MCGRGTIFNNPNNHGYFGVRLSGDIVCPGKFNVNVGGVKIGQKAFKNGGGFEVGGIYNIPVVSNLYIEPGLKFFYNSISYADDYREAMEDEMDSPVKSMDSRKLGLRIPVMIGYRFDFTDDLSVQVFTGPELEIGLSSKSYIKGKNFDVSESNYGDEGGFKRVNFSWGFGAGVNIKKFYVGISGDCGLVNLLKDIDNVSYHESRAAITLGYNF